MQRATRGLAFSVGFLFDGCRPTESGENESEVPAGAGHTGGEDQPFTGGIGPKGLDRFRSTVPEIIMEVDEKSPLKG